MEERPTLDLEAEIIACVAEALALDTAQARSLDRQTLLHGAHPEFDSMTVVALITVLEDRLGVPVAEDIGSDAFVSVGSLIDHMTPLLSR